MKKHLRILSLLMLLVMLFGMFPVFAASDLPQNQQEQIPQTAPPESEPTEVTISPETAAPTEATVPPETAAPTEATVPTETAAPTEATVPTETAAPTEATVPTETAAPTEATVPTEPTTPTEVEDLSIKVGDVVLLQEDPDDRLLSESATVQSWIMLYENVDDPIQFSYYTYDSSGSPVFSWGGGSVNEIAAFKLSNGATAFCLQPHKAGPEGNIYPGSFDSWDSIKREGIMRAMAYGAPNNGSTSKEELLATALVIWDVACGYRRSDGSMNFGSTPFGAVAAAAGGKVQAAYSTITWRMKIHGRIPSFTAGKESEIGEDQTITLKYKNGQYEAKVHDEEGILSAFHFTSPVDGLTMTAENSVLSITAEPRAVQALQKGVTIRSRRSDTRLSHKDLQVWTKSGTNDNGREYQEIISMPGIDPIPCFFRVKIAADSKATLRKTSDQAVQGYCFKLYNWETGKAWYGKTNANGDMYETNSNYNVITGTNEWTGLVDGEYAFKEALSVYGKGNVFPTYMRLTVTNAAGQVTVDKTFGEADLVQDPNGDAHPKESRIKLTGLTGGGKLTIQVHNAGSSVPFTLKKTAAGAAAEQLKGNACYSLAGAEYTVKKSGDVRVQEILVTNADGIAVSSKSYAPGTVLEIQESKAPKGFLLDKKSYTLTIQKGTNEIRVTDDPSFDPQPLAFEKKDPLTGQTAPQGNGSFEGAIFKWEYFDNYNWSGAPTRIWYFRTNEIGRHVYQKSFLAPGYQSDPLYVDAKGWNKIPLGSVKVTEIKAPAGYGQLQPLYATITQKTNGSSAEFDWTPDSEKIVESKDGRYLFPEPIVHHGSLSIRKTDPSGSVPSWVNFAGCEFTVYNNSDKPVKIGNFPTANPGEACYVLTVDAAGRAATGKIFPMGSYTIKETKGNAYYQCNTSWSQTFTVGAEDAALSFSVENTPVKGHIRLTKVDQESGKPLAGAVFEVTFPDGSKQNMTELPDGVHELRDLRYGDYSIKEIKAPEGYLLNDTVYKVSIRENGKTYVIEHDGYSGIPNQIIKGHFKLMKLEKGTKTTLQGAEYILKNPSGVQIGKYTTDEHGIIEVRDLVYGKGYTYQEVKAPEGFVLDDIVYTFDVTEHDQTYYYERENTPQPGSISVQKTDTNGNHMAGVTFLLEYSTDDGQTWTPVKSRGADELLTVGTSSTQGIVDGTLMTDADGKITFSGLRIDSQTSKIRYRLTEISTTNGNTLMAGTAFDGHLAESKEIDVVITAVNGMGFDLPHSGSRSAAIPLTGVVLIGIVLLLTGSDKFNKVRRKDHEA